MTRRARSDYAGLVQIEVPRWLAALLRAPAAVRDAVRRAYLRGLIAAAETDATRHDWHAQNEPVLATLARARAAELRVELATLTGPTKGQP